METEPTDGMRVFVYRNLHKGRGDQPIFSVQSRERIILPDGVLRYGIVFHHTTQITLRDCTFCVRHSGLRQVRETKCKNVHAGIIGRVVLSPPIRDGGMLLRYDPYIHEAFTSAAGDEISNADSVTIGSEQVGERWRSKILAFF
jgi:hypothetical protein